MKRGYMALLSVWAVVVFLTACGPTGSTRPAGVCTNGTDEYYAIKLTNGEKVSDYFKFTGTENKIAFNITYLNDQSDNLGVIYYCSVSDGGVVAYSKGETGLFLYFPETFPKDGIKSACTSLALGTIERSMSIENAQAYIPSLVP